MVHFVPLSDDKIISELECTYLHICLHIYIHEKCETKIFILIKEDQSCYPFTQYLTFSRVLISLLKEQTNT